MQITSSSSDASVQTQSTSKSSRAEIATDLVWSNYIAPTLGELKLRWSERGLSAIDFASSDLNFPAQEKRELPDAWKQALDRYFAGEKENFSSILLDLVGTDFQRRVWQALRTIPYGQVCSYGHIANVLGTPRGMRAVGTANGKNPVPIIVPCHRVIEHDGKLGGYSGGLDMKRYLLQLEGAQLRDNHVHAGQLGLFS